MNNRVLISFLAVLITLSSCFGSKKTARHKTYMERTYTDFKLALNDAEVTLMNDTVKIIFNNPAFFEFNEARVLPGMFPSFERMAKIMAAHAQTELLIVGHTDSVGGDHANNQQLSLRRADSALNVLAYYKVARKRMDTWGLGAKEPVATNATAAGRARNRRVEFVVLYNYDKATRPKDQDSLKAGIKK